MALQHRYPDEYMPSRNFLAREGKTFQHDEKLPPLPVPDLCSTLNKYLDSVGPHLSSVELQRTKSIVEQFRVGEGPTLQKLLVERAKNKRNWLDEWWLSYAYLKLRMPINPFMNVTGLGPYTYHLWPPSTGTQLRRNALSMYLLLEHWTHLRRQNLAWDSGRSGKEPWSMDQFRSLYNCCRVPGLEEDRLLRHFNTDSEGVTPCHIVVFCNRRIYKVESVLSANGGVCMPPLLEHTLSLIKQEAYSQHEGLGLSSLTTLDRTSWYHLREHLISLSPLNKEHLDTIQSAIIGNSLIDELPQDMSQMAQHGLLSKPGNVWFDKSYSAIWFENGTTVSNCDHSPMDAMTSVNVCYYADCRLIESQGVWQGPPGQLSDAPNFYELKFVVDEKIIEGIQLAEQKYLQVARNVEIINPEFGGFGKDMLKELKLHPDTFVQVCLQYGYYKLHGRPAPTYETATTRKFYKGRTETVRSCTNEAVNFAKVMMDPQSLVSHKIHMFRRAMAKHLSLMRECMSGQGVDRHLMGLKVAALENGLEIPEIFNDPAFEKSGGNGNYILSTSFIGFTSVHGGVAPMCPQGYGFFYRMGANRMIFFISTWKSDEDTSAVKLYHTVTDCMTEIIDLLSKHVVPAM